MTYYNNSVNPEKGGFKQKAMVGKYVRVNASQQPFLVIDKIDACVASGTNEYVPNTQYVLMDSNGIVDTAYPYEIKSVVNPFDINPDALKGFSRFSYKRN